MNFLSLNAGPLGFLYSFPASLADPLKTEVEEVEVFVVPASRIVIVPETGTPQAKTFLQDPLDHVDYGMDFASWFEPGSISSATVTVGDAVVSNIKVDSVKSLVSFIVSGVSWQHKVDVSAISESTGRVKNYGFYISMVDA